jgi:hypothetical protein
MMPKAYMLSLTAAQNIPLPRVRGKYGELDKTDCTAFLLYANLRCAWFYYK